MPLAEKRSQLLAESISNTFKTLEQYKHLSLHSISDSIELLLIKRIGSQGIPYKQGVGLARKIANDCAARLITKGYIDNPVIYNSDSDVIFPENYFAPINLETDTFAACLFPFKHQTTLNKLDNDACQIYQQSLQHYVDGLKSANSPFAFHTVGSTLLINVKHYIGVRGFPKKNAGEDFYILNKLRKIGNIKTLNTQNIILSARKSHRVPFGTGPAINALTNNTQAQDAPIFFDQRCFKYLKSFLSFWDEAYLNKQALSDNLLLEDLPFRFNAEFIVNDDVFLDILNQQNTSLNLTEKLQASFSKEHWQQELTQSFDALQTLKFLHYLRDQYFPSLSYKQLN